MLLKIKILRQLNYEHEDGKTNNPLVGCDVFVTNDKIEFAF